MCRRKLTFEEASIMYPRSAFPNDLAWEITVKRYMENGTCIGCPYFLEVDFDVDNYLTFEGICKKNSRAIRDKCYATCGDPM